MAIKDWSTTPASNVTISGINIAEGCPPGNVNDAIRQMMADVRGADYGAAGVKLDLINESTAGAGVTIAGVLHFAPVDSVNEGGEFVLQGAGTYAGLRLDNYKDHFRAELIGSPTKVFDWNSANGDIFTNGNKVWHAGNDGAGSGLDADKLDGYQSSDFLRLSGGGTVSAGVQWPSAGVISSASGSNAPLEVFNGANSANGAFMAFHRLGSYAAFFGLDTDNKLKIGGWSMGDAAYEIWHAGNDGAGSGLDADTLDGKHASDLGGASTNWIINGNFEINQRFASTKAQSVGVYGYDRWKGHESGLEQIVEVLPAGTYTLKWDGGGTGAFGGTTATSPITATVAGGNTSVVVPATATGVTLVSGSSPVDYEKVARSYGEERALCQRYFIRLGSSDAMWSGYAFSGNVYYVSSLLPVEMRVNPTLTNVTSLNRSGFGLPTAMASSTKSIRFNATATGTGPGYFYAGADLDSEI